MLIIVPSGEFFFTKKNKDVDLASHPRTNIKQYIQVSGCYRRGGFWGVGALFSSLRLCHWCNNKGSHGVIVSPAGAQHCSPQPASSSQHPGLVMEWSRKAIGKVKSLPLWDP